ncbi:MULTISPECIES: transcriptional regulator BolA [unclassified Salinivibrio]|jgi:BolA protein|uniref:transcriptional regulator BolA n=1 Tax=unclassified Salinivibrio TaxID=2636825 RepID=UPI00098561AC|nr:MULTISPECIES: transcriptional regulator BolA [unclassified Salinivibrio]OOF21447.1 BolA family transcriptional regulator [Salinivibrio sp. IB574]OOF28396.1 BolA family transcriptional regulator [Salinivibrio sp. IB872]PCE69118.1 BolA family transcriptional regulator [Salinivibrio sp. YCSC6]QCF36453.1 transcriptional regulator BolA [Salinivibrio sp. YCSC6]
MKIQTQITEKLEQAFSPSFLDVRNESFMHNVPEGSESHFKVVVVSEAFDGQRLIQRHRAVNATLSDELAHHIHALAIHTYTPQEWTSQAQAPDSPACRGGGK